MRQRYSFFKIPVLKWGNVVTLFLQMNIKMRGLRNLNFSSLPKYMHTLDLYSAVLCEEKVLFIHLLRIDSEFS